MPSKQRVIFGCGSQAAYVIDNLRAARKPLPSALVNLEGDPQPQDAVLNIPVKWSCQGALKALSPKKTEVIVAHGDNAKKRQTAKLLEELGFSFFSAIHPQAVVSGYAKVGPGCILNAGAVILPRATIEAHVIIHSGAVIEHDNSIGEGANIAPGVHLAGRVRVGAGAYLYTGCAVIPKVVIGDDAVIGAGAVVLHNVPRGAKVIGIPARMMAEARS